jgi:membrane protein implicated in regulation of membrane protease activity
MRSPNYNQGLPSNPIVQVVAVLVAVVIAIAAVFVGAVVLSLLVGFAIIGWLVLMMRVWWLRRQARSRGGKSRESGSGSGEIVGVEYTVVDERSMSQRDKRDLG